jgi:glutathione S-transferase
VAAPPDQHPGAPPLYTRPPMAEAARAAEAFREARMPKYLGWFERVLTAGGGPWLLGDAWTYADLSLFQLLEGLAYAFPKRMATLAADIPLTAALRERVRALPELQHYLHSERRLPFNEDGLYRY